MKRLLQFWLLTIAAIITGVHAYADESRTTAEKRLCQQLEQYQTGGADYVPGVDTEGNEVTPADLEQQAPAIFDPVIIPITIDLAARYSLSLPAGTELKPELAWMEIYRDGRVLFNGEDVQGKLKAACLLENAENPPEQDGQKSADPLVSGGN